MFCTWMLFGKTDKTFFFKYTFINEIKDKSVFKTPKSKRISLK